MKHRFCLILLNCYHLSDMRHMWTINRRLMTHWEPLITGDTLYTREREELSLELGWFYNSYSASDTCYIYSVISGGCQWPHDNVVTSSWHRVTARMWPDFLIIKTIWCLSSPSWESCAALHTRGAWCWPVSEQTIGSRNIWPGDSSDGNNPVLAHAEGHRCPAPASPATVDTCH